MSAKMIRATYHQLEELEIPAGTTLRQISKSFKREFDYDILVAKVDNDIVELCEPITKSCNIEFYDRSSYIGSQVYRSSAIFMLAVAISHLYGEEKRLYVDYSLDLGVYCRIEGLNVTESDVAAIEREMRVLYRDDYLFKKLSVSRAGAIQYYKNRNRMDKVGVLKYISNTYINLYKLDNVYDYFYTKLAYDTRQIDEFKLTLVNEQGFVLSFPSLAEPETAKDYVHHAMIYETFLKSHQFSNRLGVKTIADINQVISKAQMSDMIRLSEANYNAQLMQLANNIAEKKEIKLILLAGPSSSGKTTTACKITTFLRSQGLNLIQLSTDNYFVNREDTPKNSDGEYDFESLYALDLGLFNKHLSLLLEGKKVEIPTYNFVTGKREFKGNFLQLGPNDIIIIEGIHALNDILTLSINRLYKYKIYISPLISLGIDNYSYVHTSDLRKLRRISRDCMTRGYIASQTLHMWSSIERGEKTNIYPFQDEVDMVINSSLIYEINVLKTYVEPLLFCVEENDSVYSEALRLINFLRNFLPVPSDDVPADSVLREFIGGSCFKN